MKDVWLQLMNELAALDRDEYRRVRAAAWEAVAKNHGQKTTGERAEWRGKSS